MIERYRMINEGDALLAHVTVEDHNSFTAVWSGSITYNRSTHVTVSEEEVCAENNRDPITNEIYPIPIEDTPDF